MAFFGAWTLYNKHNKKIDDIVEVGFDKAKKVISEVSNNVKDLAEEVDVPMSINSQWNCFFNPTEKVLKSCRAKGYCEGAGVYSQHTNKNVAIRIGMDKCVKEYGSCKLDYCEKSGR